MSISEKLAILLEAGRKKTKQFGDSVPDSKAMRKYAHKRYVDVNKDWIPKERLAEETIYYRGGGRGSMPDGTAQDVIDFERDELGNDDITIMTKIDLKSINAKELMWITKTKKDAEEYGDASPIGVGKHEIIARDNDGGFLIWIPKERLAEKTIPSITANEEVIKIPEGYLEYDIFDDYMFIPHIEIKTKQRYKGHGTELMNKAIQIAKNKKLKYIQVDAVPTDMVDNIGFYKKMGFKKIRDYRDESSGEKLGETMRLKL